MQILVPRHQQASFVSQQVVCCNATNENALVAGDLLDGVSYGLYPLPSGLT